MSAPAEKKPWENRPKQERKERGEFKPKMIKIANSGVGLNKIKEFLPQSIMIHAVKDVVYVFTSAPKFVEKLKENLPTATIDLIESQSELFQEALKSQSATNLQYYKLKNAAAEKCTLIVRSAPAEAFESPRAVTYANALLLALKQPENVQFQVRGWLLDGFAALQKEQKVPVQFEVQQLRRPMIKAIDKSIIMKALVSVKDCDFFVAALAKLERAPLCMFASSEPREDRPKREYKPREDRPKREYKPREDRPKKEFKPREDRPKREYKPREDIRIDVGSRVIIDLQGMPEGTADKLMPALKAMIPATASMEKMTRGDVCIREPSGQTDFVEQIKRVKVNGQPIVITVK